MAHVKIIKLQSLGHRRHYGVLGVKTVVNLGFRVVLNRPSIYHVTMGR